MKTPVHVRPATREDLDALCCIEQGCFGAAGDAFTRRELTYLISKAQGAGYVALDGGQIVGYISLLTRKGRRNVRIYSIAVSPSAQGRGAGQTLVAEAIAYARQNGFSEVTLEVRTDNASAIALYQKNGFTADRLLRGYYHDGSDGRRMVLKLK